MVRGFIVSQCVSGGDKQETTYDTLSGWEYDLSVAVCNNKQDNVRIM
jgi:hypothetical protein